MKHLYIVFSFIILLLMSADLISAQNGVLMIDTAENGSIKFMKLDVLKNPIAASDATDFLRQTLSLSIDDSLKMYASVTDDLGFSHISYQQYYKGIKVGALRKAIAFKEGVSSTKISLANFNTGLYVISVFDGNKWGSKQILIQK